MSHIAAHRIAIIGAGSVGSSIAFAAVLKRVASEVLLVDIDIPRCEAQVLDIQDMAFMSNTKIKVGTMTEAGQCDIVCITAGAKQRPGESRIDLIDRNYKILKSCIEAMSPFKSNANLLIVANPVDILTHIAQKLSGLPHSQVFGSGTFLDSARLRSALSSILTVSETSIHAYVLGEHGDSQFVAWSSAHVGSTPLLSHPAMKDVDLKQLEKDVAHKAYKIIENKGATHYGIGGCAVGIFEAILGNTLQIRPVSHFIPELGACLSMPAVIGGRGVQQTLWLPLNEIENANLKNSAQTLKEIMQRFE